MGNPKALEQAKETVKQVSTTLASGQALPKGTTAKALRAIATYAPESAIGSQAKEILTPADSYGGIMSFRWVASLAAVLTVIFGLMYVKDKSQGGYKAESIASVAESASGQGE